MKKIVAIYTLIAVANTCLAQGSQFACDESGIYLINKSVTISLPGLSRDRVKQRILSFIRDRQYTTRPFYSGYNLISFRDFVKCCEKSNCGSDLFAKNIFYLNYDSGVIKIKAEIEIYSSFYGAELIINGNDDVASKGDVPFALYEFQVPEQYSAEYPEAIYTFSKKGKIKMKNPYVQQTLLGFYNRYITDMETYFAADR